MSSFIPPHLLQKVEDDQKNIDELRKKKLKLYLAMKKLREHSPQWQQLSAEHKLVSKDLAEAQRTFDPMPWISADDEKGIWAAVDAMEERNAKEAVPVVEEQDEEMLTDEDDEEEQGEVIRPLNDHMKDVLSRDFKLLDLTRDINVEEVVFYIPMNELFYSNIDTIQKHCTQSRGKGWFVPVEGKGIACSFFRHCKMEENDAAKHKTVMSMFTGLQGICKSLGYQYAFWVQKSVPSTLMKTTLPLVHFFEGSVKSHRIIPQSLYTAVGASKKKAPEHYISFSK